MLHNVFVAMYIISTHNTSHASLSGSFAPVIKPKAPHKVDAIAMLTVHISLKNKKTSIYILSADPLLHKISGRTLSGCSIVSI
jgi:hypothetical protein